MIACALLVACARPPAPEGLVFSGCRAVLPGGVCWSPQGTLTVWADHVEVDRGTARAEPAAGGQLARIEAEDGATVRAGSWSLRVQRAVDGVDDCVERGPDAVPLDAGPRGLCLARRASAAFQRVSAEAPEFWIPAEDLRGLRRFWSECRELGLAGNAAEPRFVPAADAAS